MISRSILCGFIVFIASCSSGGEKEPVTAFDLLTWDSAEDEEGGDLVGQDVAGDLKPQQDTTSDFDVWVAPDSTPVDTTPACLSDLDLSKPGVVFSKSCSPAAECVCGSTDLGKAIAWFVEPMKESVDVAVMELQDFSVSKALIALYQASVGVRVVVDNDYADPTTEKAIANMESAGITVLNDERTAGIMHCKYVVLDGKAVLVASGNFSTYDGRSNANDLVYLPSAELAAVFEDHFEGLYKDKDFGDPADPGPHEVMVSGYPVEVIFGPTSKSMDRIIQAIKGAKQSVWFSIYSFTSSEIRDAMDSRCNSIQIRGVYDEGQDASDQNSVATGGWCSGAKVYASAVTGTEGFLKLHHKVLIVDAGQPGAYVITGSTNWSYSAETKNDEVMLVLHDPAIVAQYAAEFNARFEEAAP